MIYCLDTEFLEGTQRTFFGKSKPTIDLISIGLVSEDGREFYAISKEFNLKEAWNRYQLKEVYGDARNLYPEEIREYWIRENVLMPIWKELSSRYMSETIGISSKKTYTRIIYSRFSYNSLAALIDIYGKTNKQIAEDIKLFVVGDYNSPDYSSMAFRQAVSAKNNTPEFYGYYCDYDWVVFCWLFGKMIDLPKGFPMYCRDLKQTLDRCQKNLERLKENSIEWKTIKGVDNLTSYPNYPKQTNEHNALDDARWTLKLHKFLEQL